jgi:hypothetical protein
VTAFSQGKVLPSTPMQSVIHQEEILGSEKTNVRSHSKSGEIPVALI